MCDNGAGRITGLPQPVWDFSVSGYRLVSRWLEARVGLPADIDPETVRIRLRLLLEKARSAEKMPWSERDARMWQTVFPNMAKWLPPEEADQLRFEFAHEMERLKRVA